MTWMEIKNVNTEPNIISFGAEKFFECRLEK